MYGGRGSSPSSPSFPLIAAEKTRPPQTARPFGYNLRRIRTGVDFHLCAHSQTAAPATRQLHSLPAPSTWRRRKISTAPPVGLCARSRAGTTRLSLATSRSPAPQELIDFAKAVVFHIPRRPVQNQQPATVARFGRLLRNEALGKFVVEQICSHQ